MRKTFTPLSFILPTLLSLGHIWACFDSFRFDANGWTGFGIFLVDLPISLLLLKLTNALSANVLIVFLIGGTVWWFCLGVLISLLVGWFCRLVVKLSKQPLPPD
jgi:hypothetical protein